MNHVEESPNTDKTQERVTFITPSLRYTLHLKTERPGFSEHGVLGVIPSLLIRFEEGKYSTNDPEIIKLLRECKPFRRGKIREITDTIKKAMEAPVQETIRGPITSAAIHEEAGKVEEKPQVQAIQEKGVTVCDVVVEGKVCGKTFEHDFGGRKLKMHKIAAHRTGIKGVKVRK